MYYQSDFHGIFFIAKWSSRFFMLAGNDFYFFIPAIAGENIGSK